jgi:hypothetical protein
VTSLSNDVTLYWCELTVSPERRLKLVETTLRKSGEGVALRGVPL